MKKSIQFMRFSLVSLMVCAMYFNGLHSTRSVDLLGFYSSSSEQKPSKAPLTMMSLLLHKYPIGLSTVDAYNRYRKKEACDQKGKQNQLRSTYQPEKLLKQEESFHAISDQSWCSVDVLDVNRENNRSTLSLESSVTLDEIGSSDQPNLKIKVWNGLLSKNSQRGKDRNEKLFEESQEAFQKKQQKEFYTLRIQRWQQASKTHKKINAQEL